ncbi:MAG: ABC transporter substrate-binding protein [Patescibacteria group bacterium]
MRRFLFAAALCLALILPGVVLGGPARFIRVGYFPNITHAQALVGMATGAFQKALGPGVEIKSFLFNAGPSAMEALMAGELDLTYVGPNPAVTCYIRTGGDTLRIVAGAASGGAGLVVRKDAGIRRPADLAGKSLATPQLGNTQDVALRHYLMDHGLKPREFGGSVRVLPTANPDQLTLFFKKEIHGAWTVEPWVSRLILEAGGRLFLDERDLWPGGMFVTGHLVARRAFLAQRPGLVMAWLRAHVAVTRSINTDPVRARRVLNREIKRYTGKALPERVLADAWGRLTITWDPVCNSLRQSARWAFELGFLGKSRPDLRGIYDLRLLNRVLKQAGLAPVEEQ